VQVLGKEGLRVAQFPEVENFWADPAQLAFGHRGIYQASDHHNQGQAADCAWEYRITPVTGWGRDEATMGLLSYLPVYEVGWQICLAHGWAEGWFQWQDQRYEFSQAPVYIEKNWGLGYPKVWFWLQCNCFTVTTGTPDLNLTLTSGGGLRRTLWWEDEAAMIGVHYRGRFFNFRPETGAVRWETASVPHGTWKVWGKADGYEVEIEADVAILHTLLGPTATATLHPISLHSLTGHLNLRLYRGARKLILEAHSDLAALEVGGGNWDGTWSGSCN
jgi:tocopherol cyclase